MMVNIPGAENKQGLESESCILLAMLFICPLVLFFFFLGGGVGGRIVEGFDSLGLKEPLSTAGLLLWEVGGECRERHT
jgi:hypothetical protein